MGFPPPDGVPANPSTPSAWRTALLRLGAGLFVLVLLFHRPILDLAHYSFASSLYSHLPLIPLVSLYLGWNLRHRIVLPSHPDRVIAVTAIAFGICLLASYWLLPAGPASEDSPDTHLALITLSWLSFLLASAAAILGRRNLRTLIFPLGFLLFLVPIPTELLTTIETFLQHGSAAVARLLFSAAGSTFFYQDLIFQLPGIALQVAPECSGIRSTLVLLITSTLVSHLFLRSNSLRILLVLLIIPLGLIRNGFRIFVIGELCVRIGPEMIDSFIHRHGGPIFFAASLVPLVLFLLFFIWIERRRGTQIRHPTNLTETGSASPPTRQ